MRCAVSSFRSVGAIVDRSALIATVPRFVGQHILRERPHLRVDPLPLPLEGGVVELLWPLAVDDDECYAFLRAEIVKAARALTEAGARRRRAAAR